MKVLSIHKRDERVGLFRVYEISAFIRCLQDGASLELKRRPAVQEDGLAEIRARREPDDAATGVSAFIQRFLNGRRIQSPAIALRAELLGHQKPRPTREIPPPIR